MKFKKTVETKQPAPTIVETPKPKIKTKKEKEEGAYLIKESGSKLVKDLKPGDIVIYSGHPCEVLSIGKCLDKTKSYFKMVSLHKHPIHGALTLPCLANDSFSTAIVSRQKLV